MNHQQIRCCGCLGDGGEIADRIIGQLGSKAGLNGEARAGCQQRVSVGIRLGDHVERQQSTGTGSVVDDDLLTPDFGEPPDDDTHRDVRSTPRTEADQQAHRTHGIVGRRGLALGFRRRGAVRKDASDGGKRDPRRS